MECSFWIFFSSLLKFLSLILLQLSDALFLKKGERKGDMYIVRQWERERDRERDRERESERETERETERQRERHTETETETER